MGNLDAKRDWGHARDYVEMQWLMLQQDSPTDYVIATGEQISVRDFMVRVFNYLGIDIAWRGEGLDEVGVWVQDENGESRERIIVRVDPEYFRPAEVETLLGDITKAHRELGWKPRVSIDQLIAEMVASDEQLAREEAALRISREK